MASVASFDSRHATRYSSLQNQPVTTSDITLLFTDKISLEYANLRTSQPNLADWIEFLKNVDDIFPLSPMQEVMLLHALTNGGHDALFNQFCYQINSSLDTTAFESAWRQVVQRHPVLRAMFVWEGVKRPVQVIRSSVALDVRILDWRDSTDTDLQFRFDEFRAADRETGFDLTRAPLLRFTLIRVSDESWYFVWSSHHLLLDRWCLDEIFADFDRFYTKSNGSGSTKVDQAPSYRKYIEWVGAQDQSLSLHFWRQSLAGFSQPLSLTVSGSRADKLATFSETLNAKDTESLRKFARNSRVSLSTLVQAAWALTLNAQCARQDIVFGAAVSGRPVDLDGVEAIVGSFISNVPVRVRLPAEQTLADLFSSLQSAQVRRTPHEYVSPIEIQRCSDLPHGKALFDCLLVWLAPGKDVTAGASLSLPMRGLNSDMSTGIPFTLSIAEQTDSLGLHASVRGQPVESPADLLLMLANVMRSLPALSTSEQLQSIVGFRHEPAFQNQVVLDAPEYSAPTLTEFQEIDLAFRCGRESLTHGDYLEFIREEWQQVLGQAPNNPSADFFVCGGTSIIAAQLHARVVAALRIDVPLLHLFRKPTLDGMATVLANNEWPVSSGIVIPLRERGHGAPLFCVASPEVNTLGYSLLMRHMRTQQPFYVLQAPPDSERMRRLHPSEIANAALEYVGAMRAVQANGPYEILGMCSGSLIALEMARELERVGENVRFLGIVNTWAHYTVSKLYKLARAVNQAKYYRRRIWGVVATRLSLGPGANQKSAVPSPDAQSPAQTEGAMADEQEGPSPWIQEYGYEHLDPDGPRVATTVTVLRIARQPYWRIHRRDLGWGKHAEGVRIIDLPGKNHDFILREPGVRTVAEAIDECLNNNNDELSKRRFSQSTNGELLA